MALDFVKPMGAYEKKLIEADHRRRADKRPGRRTAPPIKMGLSRKTTRRFEYWNRECWKSVYRFTEATRSLWESSFWNWFWKWSSVFRRCLPALMQLTTLFCIAVGNCKRTEFCNCAYSPGLMQAVVQIIILLLDATLWRHGIVLLTWEPENYYACSNKDLWVSLRYETNTSTRMFYC